MNRNCSKAINCRILRLTISRINQKIKLGLINLSWESNPRISENHSISKLLIMISSRSAIVGLLLNLTLELIARTISTNKMIIRRFRQSKRAIWNHITIGNSIFESYSSIIVSWLTQRDKTLHSIWFSIKVKRWLLISSWYFAEISWFLKCLIWIGLY